MVFSSMFSFLQSSSKAVNVTKLFHEEEFDGPIEQDEDYNPNNPKDIPEKPPVVDKPENERKPKYVISGEPVTVSQQQIQYLGKDGKLITESLVDYTKKSVLSEYSSVDNFVNACNEADRKQVIVEELEKRGKPIEDWWIDIYTADRVRSELTGYPTQKPTKLLERIINASSNPGDIVLDCFMGSGTTLIVAKELNRNYIGCDINPRAVEIANERLK